MKKLFFVALLFCSGNLLAQDQSVVQEGEFGISAGAAHYFGDLNPAANSTDLKLHWALFSGSNLEIMWP